jgi:hypothetical protein
MKEKLIVLREQIQTVLAKVRLKYAENERILKTAKDKTSFGSKSNDIHGYYKCGAPYFKDALLQPAPYNSDYLRRKETKEFFPFDQPQEVLWKFRHKTALLLGVKKQMIEHIISKQSINAVQTGHKTRSKKETLKTIAKASDLKNMNLLDISNNIEKNFPTFEINWSKIAFDDLESTHTSIECLGMWNSYLRPDLMRDDWSLAENDQLLEAVEAFNYENWEVIAQQLPGRSSLQCFIHFQVDFKRLYQIGEKWTQEEDNLLVSMVQKYTKCGVVDWNKIGEVFKTRNKTQCYNRYRFSIRENIKKGVFSKEEDEKILDFVDKYGENFNKIPLDLFPNRTSVQIRNHYNNALKHRGVINTWTTEEDKKLVEYVKTHGLGCSWKAIADILGTHSRVGCRSRYMTISKYLEKNPQASLEEIPVKRKKAISISRIVGNEELGSNTLAVLKPKPLKVLKEEEIYPIIRAQHKKLFHTFKLVYNYPENQQILRVDKDTTTTSLLLFKILGVDESHFKADNQLNFPPSLYQKIVDTLNSELSVELTREMFKLVQTKNLTFYLPPSYNTIVGLRGIALKAHYAEEEKEIERKKVDKNIYKGNKYDEALNEFKSRFFRLFYWPAMLAKLNVGDLPRVCDAGVSAKEEDDNEEYSAVDFVLEIARKVKMEAEVEEERTVLVTYGESSKRTCDEIDKDNKRIKK